MAAKGVYCEAKRLYSSLQEMVGLRRRKRQLQISEPFNFKKEPTIIPGLTEDEISVLRDKAAASRLGIADADADADAFTAPPASFFPILRGSPSTPVATTPQLSMPIPIPVGGGKAANPRRLTPLRGSSTSGAAAMSSAAGAATRLSSSTNDLDLLLFGNPSGTEAWQGPGPAGAVGGAGMAADTDPDAERDYCYYHHHPATALLVPLSTVSTASSSISPLELDSGTDSTVTTATTTTGAATTTTTNTTIATATTSGTGGREKGRGWDMEFDFLASPVSPLSPPRGWRMRGKRLL